MEKQQLSKQKAIVNMYSPNQVLLSTILFGPLATIFLVSENFIAVDKRTFAQQTLFAGIVTLFIVLAIMLFFIDTFPSIIITIAYAVAGRQMVENSQMSKQAIRESSQHDFQSNWKVFGIALLSLLGFVVMVVITLVFMSSLDLISLDKVSRLT